MEAAEGFFPRTEEAYGVQQRYFARGRADQTHSGTMLNPGELGSELGKSSRSLHVTLLALTFI